MPSGGVHSNEIRVRFDFEIDLLGGGAIQGRDIRLDVAGDDVSDHALAAYLLSDLRLVMTGEVRILNKAVLVEQHQLSTPGWANIARSEPARLIDLSHVIEHGMVTYKGLPAPLICDHLSRAQSRDLYAPGTEFQIDRIEMVGNTGTYLDTPFHRYANGEDLAALALARVADCPGVVVRVEGSGQRAIDWTAFVESDVAQKAVLVHTGWDRHWRRDAYFEGHPHLTEAAAVYLRDQGALLVGIDSFNIDNTAGDTRPVHSILLGAGLPIVEHMTNLGALPVNGFRFFAVPPKVRRMGTFPVRAHALLPSFV